MIILAPHFLSIVQIIASTEAKVKRPQLFLFFRSYLHLQYYLSINHLPATAFSLFLATQELRPSQLKPVGDPVQSGGVLLHVVQLRDL